MGKCIGVIGGTGLDNPDFFVSEEEIGTGTAYGQPSSPLRKGHLKGCDTPIVLLARHGLKHTIPPHMVNDRANITALKEAGCTHILASTACGSLQDSYAPGDLAVPDQFIDFTRSRKLTFFDHFEPGAFRHTPMADPFDSSLRKMLLDSAADKGLHAHDGGTIVTIEGPRFSTRAESRMFRVLGGDLINMSVAPECIMACEAGLPYAVMAMVTDYDSWSESREPLDIAELLRVLDQNVHLLLQVFMGAIRRLSA